MFCLCTCIVEHATNDDNMSLGITFLCSPATLLVITLVNCVTRHAVIYSMGARPHVVVVGVVKVVQAFRVPEIKHWKWRHADRETAMSH